MKKLNVLIALFLFLLVSFFISSNIFSAYEKIYCYHQGGDPNCWRYSGCYGNYATGVGCLLSCYWDENSPGGEADCGGFPE